jgi:alpha-1,3-mannosyltransferase
MLRLSRNMPSRRYLSTALSNSRIQRLILLSVSVSTFFSVLLLLTVHRDDVRRSLEDFNAYHETELEPDPKAWCLPDNSSKTTTGFEENEDLLRDKLSKVPPSVLPPRKGDKQRLVEASRYVHAILDPQNTDFRRYDCLALTPNVSGRYTYLRKPYISTTGGVRPKYFFALDLHEIVGVLPQLLGSLVEAIRFLGPHNCVLSIVEGRSKDGTYETLRSLGPEFEKMGLRYFLQTSDLHPQMNGDRIVLLAELRNLALRDIYEQPHSYASDTTIVFSNDIWLCTEDVLELVHQHFTQGSHMTCAMDFNLGPTGKPRYYDGWVGRSMTGNSFYRGWWEGAPREFSEKFLHIPFWDDEPTRRRFEGWQPVQVYACWNGIVVLNAEPFMNGTIRFRGVEYDQEECFQGEPTLLAKDLWLNGYGRTAVVPTVNTAYFYDHLEIVRRFRGGVSDHLCQSDIEKIVWKTHPPEKVKCKPSWQERDSWVPWNQGFVESTK